MKEIGGYFELENFSGNEYHKELVALNNGRCALLYLLQARNIRKLYIPYYLCDSVSSILERYNFSYSYYSIGSDFLPIFSEPLGEREYIYIVNFYGQISNSQLRDLKEKYSNVIFDNIHAFFQKPVPGVDTVYSCRKFFGVPDGGYLATDAVLDVPLELDVSKDRMRHILGRYEAKASDYHADFKENDKSFADLPLRGMSRLTHNLLRAVDYDAVRQKRNENYALLEKALGSLNSLHLKTPDGPYAYPFYCKKGMALKRALASKKIYVATLWPNVLSYDGTLEKNYAENILPLPCDQRYGAEDMQRIISEVQQQI